MGWEGETDKEKERECVRSGVGNTAGRLGIAVPLRLYAVVRIEQYCGQAPLSRGGTVGTRATHLGLPGRWNSCVVGGEGRETRGKDRVRQLRRWHGSCVSNGQLAARGKEILPLLLSSEEW